MPASCLRAEHPWAVQPCSLPRCRRARPAIFPSVAASPASELSWRDAGWVRRQRWERTPAPWAGRESTWVLSTLHEAAEPSFGSLIAGGADTKPVDSSLSPPKSSSISSSSSSSRSIEPSWAREYLRVASESASSSPCPATSFSGRASSSGSAKCPSEAAWTRLPVAASLPGEALEAAALAALAALSALPALACRASLISACSLLRDRGAACELAACRIEIFLVMAVTVLGKEGGPASWILQEHDPDVG